MTLCKFLALSTSFFLFINCIGQGTSSSSLDDIIYSETDDSLEGQSIKIIQTNCISCHSAWASYSTSSDYIDAGLVTAGDSTNSSLITSLQNEGGDMPQNLSALSSSDYYILKDWVDGL